MRCAPITSASPAPLSVDTLGFVGLARDVENVVKVGVEKQADAYAEELAPRFDLSAACM